MAKETQATADAPELGALELCGVALSEGEHWREDGDYVFRSTEFDVIVGAPSFEEALRRFGDEVLSFALYLAELEDPAENEAEMVRLASPRIVEIVGRIKAQLETEDDEDAAAEAADAQPCEERRALGTATRERRPGHHVSEWQPIPRRHSSARLSLA